MGSSFYKPYNPSKNLKPHRRRLHIRRHPLVYKRLMEVWAKLKPKPHVIPWQALAMDLLGFKPFDVLSPGDARLLRRVTSHLRTSSKKHTSPAILLACANNTTITSWGRIPATDKRPKTRKPVRAHDNGEVARELIRRWWVFLNYLPADVKVVLPEHLKVLGPHKFTAVAYKVGIPSHLIRCLWNGTIRVTASVYERLFIEDQIPIEEVVAPFRIKPPRRRYVDNRSTA